MSLADVLAGRRGWHVETTDVLAGLAQLPDGCVQTVCTSPPYWGLRAYSTEPQVWGGADCEHDWETVRRPIMTGGSGTASLKQVSNTGSQMAQEPWEQGTCTRCNAWRGELGSEPTPALFVAHLVAVFAEVKRVLRDDGTVWLNIADSYSGSGKGGYSNTGIVGDHVRRQGFDPAKSTIHRSVNGQTKIDAREAPPSAGKTPDGIPAKSLCLIPERLAIALQDDGWIIRSRICWAKAAPMPESVTDRPTSAWEHLWLLTKRPSYWYDAEAVRSPSTTTPQRRFTPTGFRTAGLHSPLEGEKPLRDEPLADCPESGANLRNVWLLPPEPFDAEFCTACHGYYQGTGKAAIRVRTVDGERRRVCPCGRHDAWLSHFATYSTEIVRRAVLAGTSAHGACPTCGAGWVRTSEHSPMVIARSGRGAAMGEHGRTQASGTMLKPAERTTTGWQPTCACNDPSPVVPPIVLDPFSGSGTSALVAHQLGRRAIGLELNPSYCDLARARIANDAPLVEAVAAAEPWAQAGLFTSEETA